MTDTNILLTAALEYAAKGLPVFPCKCTDKRPLTKNGFKDATTDRGQIRAWWTQWPDAMIGMPTGQLSGIDVLDLDVKKGKNGFAAVPDWADRSTIVVRTPSDPKLHTEGAPDEGGHLWYKSDGTIKNTTDTIALGVDTRGAGGYVILPPSANDFGAYRFEKGGLNEMAKLPAFPADLAARCKKVRKPRTQSEEPQATTKPQTNDYALIVALVVIPNTDDLGHDEWKIIMLAVWQRTHGSAAGLAAFTPWSKKSKKHDDDFTIEAWEGITNSPPTELDEEAILHIADKAEPGWRWRILLHVQGSGDYSSCDELLSAFLGEALRQGIDDSKIIKACLSKTYSGNGIFEHIKENGGEEYLKKQIAAVLNEHAATTGKAIIRCKKGERYIITDRTQAALIAAKCPVFYRGGVLVEPLWRWEKTSEDNREALATSLVKLNPARLSYMTGKHAAAYYKYNGTNKKWDAIDPPKEMIEQLLDLGHWGFDTIKGIINSPTMRPDGSLLTDPGYDKATQLWHKSSGDIELPDIPERPTKEDALAALKLLADLLAGFPFMDDISKAVAIAGLMTPVLRGAFEFAPLFLILAPEPGSGKSYLVQTIGTLATGRAPVPVPMTEDKNEMDKRLSAVAFGAKPILHLNNLDFDLESSLLNQMITEGIVEIRPFGKNDQTITCDCRGSTIFANGNNVRIVGDLVRRTLTARLDAKSETPETRKFNFDPVDYVKADRGKYLAAVFTIVRGYMAAGSPKMEASSLAGFDSWTRMVRLPLMWLGMTDPVKSMEGARALDPERSALRQRIDGLAEAFGINQHFTAAEVQARATAVTADANGNKHADHPELLEGFLRPDGRPISSKSIGNQLIKDLDRVMGGRWIERVVADAHGNQYQVCGTPTKF